MKEPVAHNPKRDPEQRPQSLEGATFGRLDRRSYSPPSPPQPSLSNAQITLDYRVHREIFRAIAGNDEAALRATWRKHPNVSIRAEEAIAVCVELERFELVAVILDLGGKPDKVRSSLLEELLIARRFDVLKLLVEAGAPVNNEAGDSEALSRAVAFFHIYIRMRAEALSSNRKMEGFDFAKIEFLLEHGAQMDASLPEVRRSPVFSTSNSGHWIYSHYSALFSLFEKHHVALRTDYIFGEFALPVQPVHPIEEAITEGDTTRVRQMLRADPHILSVVKNPLSRALVSDHSVEMVQCLIDYECDVNEDLGKPLLQTCPAHGYINPSSTPAIVRLLLNYGADPTRRQAEAFLNACKGFPDSLGIVFWHTLSFPNNPRHFDVALRGLLGNSNKFPDLGLVSAQHREEPGLKHLSMVKALVDRGADPYCAGLDLLRKPSIAPFHDETGFEPENETSHYTAWREYLRASLSVGSLETASKLDNRYRDAHYALSSRRSLMQLGDHSRQRASLSSVSHRYCHLMAQVLEPSGECWINSLIVGNHRKIADSMISPSLLQHDSRYKMVSDVATIAAVLHPPFMLRQRFIELAKATLSDKVKLKESQERNESVLEWLPITKRLVRHFSESVLLPTLLSYVRSEAVPYLTSAVLELVREDLSFVTAEALFEGRTSREIRDFTKRWYALSDKHPIPISTFDGWNSILKEPILLPNGFVVRDITSVHSLRELGRRMNNCLADGVHAAECYHGRSRIFAIFRDEVPVVAMTLQKSDAGWQLTEYEGHNYTKPDDGPDSPLTHFKDMFATKKVKLYQAQKNSIRLLRDYDSETSDGVLNKYSNYLDNNRTSLDVHANNWFLQALRSPGIDAAAFYRRWVVLKDKHNEANMPLLRDSAIPKCDKRVREMAEAISLFLEYSKKLYENYPEWTVKNPDYSPSFR